MAPPRSSQVQRREGAHVGLSRVVVQQFRVIPGVRRVIPGNVINFTSVMGIPENPKFAHENFTKFQVLHKNSRSCMEIPGRTWKFQVVRTPKLPFVKGPPMPRWLRRPFVASRSLWVGGLCRRSSAGCWLACWLVSKKEATTERRAHDPNNPKSPNASPARHAPRRCLVSRRAADGRARGVRSTRSESAQQRGTPRRRAEERRPTTGDRQTTRGDRRGETKAPRRSRQPPRPDVAALHARDAARRGGWVRRVHVSGV